MTFTEAALEILRREGQPLHFKELTERAMTKKLLTFVGRTPEVTMQTQLTAAVKKAPGNPFVRVKPGVFGLLRYPELSAEEKAADKAPARSEAKADENRPARAAERPERKDDRKRDRVEKPAAESALDERGRRRRRRGGRGRGGAKETDPTRAEGAGSALVEQTDGGPDDGADEPSAGGLSPEARAAALAETGVLEGNDDMMSADDDADDLGGAQDGSDVGDVGNARPTASHPDRGKQGGSGHSQGSAVGARSADGEADGDVQDGDGDGAGDDGDDDEGGAFGSGEPATGDKPLDAEAGRRRRRRRRRRRGPGEGEGEPGDVRDTPRSDEIGAESSSSRPEIGSGGPQAGSSADAAGDTPGPVTGEGPAAGAEGTDAGQPARKIMAPVDAALEILRGQPPGRGVHVRQIADSAIRRRLIHGEPNEAWRVIRTALAAEPKDRLRNGMRPRVRSAGAGLFALARRTPDPELEKAEQVFGEARRALRERTIAALERRLAELPPGAFEALARVLLQREGFGPTTFVKRVDGTIYVEALRGRGSRPSKCLIALRPGAGTAGRRAIGELRAGIRARGQDEGLLMLSGRLAEDAISEWKQSGSPMEIADGAALAETCARHGVGVLPAVLNVDFVDADFFAELAEG